MRSRKHKIQVINFPGNITVISLTPANLAKTPVMRTEEGYCAFPPGAYKPTLSIGLKKYPYFSTVSSSSSTDNLISLL